MRRRIPGPDRRAAGRLAAWVLLAAALAGCAKKGMPSGGPPDLERPRLITVAPDSGAASVGPRPEFTLTFSEPMEPRTTGAAINFIPPLEIAGRRWSRGRTLTVRLADTLAAGQVYQLVVDASARDAHGNLLANGRTVAFTTAARFPPGRIEGRLEGVGFTPAGVALWAYRDGRAPDSTARDFDAVGITDRDGLFRIAGLSVPQRWTLWAFVDLDGNRSFEPERDLLVRADTTFALTAADSVAGNVRFRVVNPRAPGTLRGTILDTLGVREGALRLYAISERDTLRRLLGEANDAGRFELSLEPGPWRLRAFRDLDRNRIWKRDSEAASLEVRLEVAPGGSYLDLPFVLLPAPVEDGP